MRLPYSTFWSVSLFSALWLLQRLPRAKAVFSAQLSISREREAIFPWPSKQYCRRATKDTQPTNPFGQPSTGKQPVDEPNVVSNGTVTKSASSDVLVVGGGGAYSTVQSAITAAASKCSGGGPVNIFINAGTYREQVHIPRNFACDLVVKGASNGGQNEATITYNQGRQPYTSTSTMVVESGKTTSVYNLNVENTFGRAAQAPALFATGPGRQAYYGCKFEGYQDTCFGGAASTFFGKCSIIGAVDFIWGQDGNAWYEGCAITVTAYGWVTAAGRGSAGGRGWIVLDKCAIDGQGKAQSYLGRPWGTYARASIQNSQIGGVIKPAGWDKMGEDKPGAELSEYGNTGEGATGPRSSLGKTAGGPVSITDVLGDTSWIDRAYL